MTIVRGLRALSQCATKSCSRTLFLGALFLGMVGVESGVQAFNTPNIPPNFVAEDGEDLQLAIRLETEFWTAVQTHNLGQLSSILAPEFQALGGENFMAFGAISRTQEIVELMSSHLAGFLLSNVVATRKHNVLVITYFLIVSGNSTGIVSGPTLSTWKKTKEGWQMVSHAFEPAIG